MLKKKRCSFPIPFSKRDRSTYPQIFRKNLPLKASSNAVVCYPLTLSMSFRMLRATKDGDVQVAVVVVLLWPLYLQTPSVWLWHHCAKKERNWSPEKVQQKMTGISNSRFDRFPPDKFRAILTNRDANIFVRYWDWLPTNVVVFFSPFFHHQIPLWIGHPSQLEIADESKFRTSTWPTDPLWASAQVPVMADWCQAIGVLVIWDVQSSSLGSFLPCWELPIMPLGNRSKYRCLGRLLQFTQTRWRVLVFIWDVTEIPQILAGLWAENPSILVGCGICNASFSFTPWEIIGRFTSKSPNWKGNSLSIHLHDFGFQNMNSILSVKKNTAAPLLPRLFLFASSPQGGSHALTYFIRTSLHAGWLCWSFHHIQLF